MSSRDEERDLESSGGAGSHLPSKASDNTTTIHPVSTYPSDEELAEADAKYVFSACMHISRFQAKDTDFWIFQHFNRLNLFRIVYLQQRLAKLEKQLDQAIPTEKGVWNCDAREVEELMPDIQATLKQYEDAIASQTRHKSFRTAPQRSMDMLGRFCKRMSFLDDEYRCCIHDDTQRSKYVCIATEEKGWIHKAVDHSRLLRRLFAEKGSKSSSSSSSSSSSPITFYSEPVVRRAEKLLITLAFCILLIMPILILSHLDNSHKAAKLAIVFVFVVLLSVFTIDLAESTNRTSVALVAPYAAILVVFLTTSGPSS